MKKFETEKNHKPINFILNKEKCKKIQENLKFSKTTVKEKVVEFLEQIKNNKEEVMEKYYNAKIEKLLEKNNSILKKLENVEKKLEGVENKLSNLKAKENSTKNENLIKKMREDIETHKKEEAAKKRNNNIQNITPPEVIEIKAEINEIIHKGNGLPNKKQISLQYEDQQMIVFGDDKTEAELKLLIAKLENAMNKNRDNNTEKAKEDKIVEIRAKIREEIERGKTLPDAKEIVIIDGEKEKVLRGNDLTKYAIESYLKQISNIKLESSLINNPTKEKNEKKSNFIQKGKYIANKYISEYYKKQQQRKNKYENNVINSEVREDGSYRVKFNNINFNDSQTNSKGR